MSGNSKEKGAIKCPYYLKHGKFYVDCEGLGKGKKTTISFDTYKEKEQHIIRNCNRYPNKCPVAEMLEKKYS